MRDQILREMRKARRAATVSMRAVLVLASHGIRDAQLIERAKLRLEDYRRCKELGEAMLAAQARCGLGGES